MKDIELTLEQTSERTIPRTEKQKNTRHSRRWIVWLAAVLVWGSLSYLSYNFVTTYMEENRVQLQQIEHYANGLGERVTVLQTQLAEQLAEQLATQEKTTSLLEANFSDIERQLVAVQEQMSFADQSLLASDETKQALSARIADLGKELDELRKLIKKLEAAARVY